MTKRMAVKKRFKNNTIQQEFGEAEIKPCVLENRVSRHEDFMKLSDGFRRVFSNDKTDKKIVLPIAGYGGHRRGDRSQNFFGKSFRESSL